jgi:hypothetical protein
MQHAIRVIMFSLPIELSLAGKCRQGEQQTFDEFSDSSPRGASGVPEPLVAAPRPADNRSMHPTRSTVILGAALAASLAVNAIALWPHGEPVAQPAPSTRRVPSAPKKHAEADPAAQLRACEDRLKARQAKDALRSLAAGLRASRDGKAEEAVDDEDRDGVRCRIAEQQMRDRWREKEKETLANVRKSLSDAAGVEDSTVQDAKRIAKSLGSSAADRERLAERYRPLRKSRMTEILAAIETDRPDYGAAQAAFRGLWRDEDRLVSEIYGPSAGERFAADADEGRLGVLMIIAAMSGGPLPESVF